MTQLTFSFETVPATPPSDHFLTASSQAEQPTPAKSNVVVSGRISRRQRGSGLQHLSDVLADVLAQYEDGDE